ncbi:MAG: phosphonate degradation HD-domain oxygenase [Cyclobacteriaceae bacterium]|jgi:phosphonate degradation associated HDIG domain protein|nr:HD domain-containing protein [Flammeovirgaceae bacterium]
MTPQDTIHEIFALYEKYGHEDYIGEAISQIEHMSQAAQLAIEGGFDDEVILAAFFHDIGHICVSRNAANNMGGFGVKSHEKIGADYLREKGFSERIAKLVENHVEAKRYLTFRYPEYYNNLSEASKRTLEYQGGKMTAEEADVFEQDSLFEASIQLRKWDELAKEIETPLIDLEIIKAKATSALASTFRN